MSAAFFTLFAHATDGHHDHTAASINLAVYAVGVGTLALIILVAVLVYKPKKRRHKTK